MHARVGDWIVVKNRTLGGKERRAEVVGVRGAHGEPPYTVRWLDEDRECLVFPGPDAMILSHEQIEQERAAADRRLRAVQSSITAHEHVRPGTGRD
jgi:hypothetical protein